MFIANEVVGEVMFSQASVILSTGDGEVWQTAPWADTPTPWADPSGRHTPLDRHNPPWADTPLPSACWDTPLGSGCWDTPPPSACWDIQTPWADTHLPSVCWDTPPPPKATAADGTHSTGMHSCFMFLFFFWRICLWISNQFIRILIESRVISYVVRPQFLQ